MTTYNLVEALDRCQILVIVGVGNLAGCPLALIGRVVNHGSVPFALVLGVGLHRATGIKCKYYAFRQEYMHAHRFHSPQPGASSHMGLWTVGAIQSPSSSSSHSSGFSASDTASPSIQPCHIQAWWRTRVRNSLRLVIKPPLGFLSLLVRDLIGLILVPIIRL